MKLAMESRVFRKPMDRHMASESWRDWVLMDTVH